MAGCTSQFQLQPTSWPITSILSYIRQKFSFIYKEEWKAFLGHALSTSNTSFSDTLPISPDVLQEYEVDYIITGNYRLRLKDSKSYVSADTFFENKHGFAYKSQLQEVRSHILGRNTLSHTHPNLFGLLQTRGFKTKRVQTSDVDRVNRGVPFTRITPERIPADEANDENQKEEMGSSFMLPGRRMFTGKTVSSLVEELPPDSRKAAKESFYEGYHTDLTSLTSNKNQYNPSDISRIAFADGYRQRFGGRDTKSTWSIIKRISLTVGLAAVIVSITAAYTYIRAVRITYNAEIQPENVKVRFDDVKGIDECKEELISIVDFLRNSEKYSELGAKLPKGCLLVGPPGVGKTLLARAVAGEAGVPFFMASGSEFDEIFVGSGAKKVRELFRAAKERAPCVIFIDEIDSVGGKRTQSPNHPYANQTINQLLTELDGFEPNEGIIVLGATNLKGRLDPALTRPGRFDLEINIDPPNRKGREEILQLYCQNKVLDGSVDIPLLAQRTSRCTGADLENLCNQAAMTAAKAQHRTITGQDFEIAFDKIFMGIGKKRLNMDQVNRCTAYHEAGHALVVYHSKSANVKLHKLTILPRGSTLGVTHMTSEDYAEYSVSKAQLLAQIDIAMGGRVAEELTFGEDSVTTGASSDMTTATGIADNMVRRFGFSDKMGFRIYPADSTVQLSDKLQQQLDEEIHKILQDSYDRVKRLLTAKQHELKLLAEAVLERETLDAEQTRQVIEGKKIESVKKELKSSPRPPTSISASPIPILTRQAPSGE